jgi:hypothetical protein
MFKFLDFIKAQDNDTHLQIDYYEFVSLHTDLPFTQRNRRFRANKIFIILLD